MNRSSFPPFAVFIGSVALLVATSLPSIAATFSGRVVDEAGRPVEGIIIALSSFEGNVPPRLQRESEPLSPPARPSETDETGAFSITDIVTPSVNMLIVLPEHETPYEFRGIDIEGVVFHLDPRMHRWQRGGLPFAIVPGADVKDVKITVRLRMRIRCRVLSTDGTPLRNAAVDFSLSRRGVNGGNSSNSGKKTLDADGYFIEYLNEAAYCTVFVAYQGRSAESEEILIKDRERHENLVLTLGDVLDSPESEPVKVVPRLEPIQNLKPLEAKPFESAWKRQREGIWAINPENQHAYKRISCKSREAAAAQAIAQGAYLVAINDEAEQQWLLEVFGRNDNFWIGLTEGGKDGRPYWDNGEPIAYTNWDVLENTAERNKPPQNAQNGGVSQNYFVLVGLTGQWQVARQGSPLIRLTEKAILEKENLIVGVPERDDAIEKR